ncbi:GNAT family N-acetyltransferase [Spirochaeta isovalerica]|uniref:Arginine-tRNA-protein transferase n=1 Tax=Spirochaeta isovalerica TaxID=150 RepID=A0A841R7P6_9SPIO|nr:GNAT family N-acetyltransferase [Spirochaeta isovalerica]MBB6479401.1 arginine-tRNA-protein transferase [Spirochaeta isovalerica]
MHYYEVLKPTECTGDIFDILLSLGWYPMGQTIFTTSHLFREEDTPPARVHWLRYPVSSLADKISHRRIRKKNNSFTIELADPFIHRVELNELYEKYIAAVEFDGYKSVEKATYRSDETNIYRSKAILVRDGDRLISCGIFHQGAVSVASVLHFYDPDYRKYSPGKYLILKTLDYCRKEGLEWYYPGYVIRGNPKMDYKLFLGQDKAQYYLPEPNPLSGTWLPFSSDLLTL